ncbi:hypothetical protein LguiB_004205 [Lonicera macranthoides]
MIADYPRQPQQESRITISSIKKNSITFNQVFSNAINSKIMLTRILIHRSQHKFSE